METLRLAPPRCIQWAFDNKEQRHRDGPTTIREKGCREGAANVKDVGVTGKGQELLGKARGTWFMEKCQGGLPLTTSSLFKVSTVNFIIAFRVSREGEREHED